MSYPTMFYPEWSGVEPKVHKRDVSEFVQTATWAMSDIFGEFYSIHQPERAALGECKRKAVYAAIAINNTTGTDGTPTIGDVAEHDDVRELAEERGVADIEVDPVEVALAAYAVTVSGRDWLMDTSDLDENAFIFLHDGLRTLADTGKQQWNTETTR